MVAVRGVDDETLALAASVIRKGGVIVIPTDTVYGVACDPRNEAAVERLFAVKHRPREKSLQVLMSCVDDAAALALTLPSPLDVLSHALLPGGLSPIAVAGRECSLVTTAVNERGERTQGVRVPNCPALLRVLAVTGPLAASSANLSGGVSAQCVEEAVRAFGDSVDLYIDDGPTRSHVPSTVVMADATAPRGVRVLREGVLERAVIDRVLDADDAGIAVGVPAGADAARRGGVEGVCRERGRMEAQA